MGRPRKEVSGVDAEAVADSKIKKQPLKLVAKYKSKDEDGNRIIIPFDSTGETPEEVLENLKFPKGCNALVNVTVTQGEKEFSRALAPHVARQILEGKDENLFQRLILSGL